VTRLGPAGPRQVLVVFDEPALLGRIALSDTDESE